MNIVLRMRRAEEKANRLGFMFADVTDWRDDQKRIYLKPKDADSLLGHSCDMVYFTGTLYDVESFIEGINWAREYDSSLQISNTEKRERKEQDIRNKKLLKILKT